MQVQQIVRASADVLTITRLSPGDCYKRVEESDYSGPSIKIGIVQSVMNNGEDAAVTALEYQVDYADGIKVAMKVFTGGKPAAIFPATPEEVAAHVSDIENAARRAVEKAAKDLDAKRAAHAAVVSLIGNLGTITAPETGTNVLDATPESE